MNVLFIHGWACGWQDWIGVVSLLSKTVRPCIARLPGSPEGPALGNARSIHDVADYVAEQAQEQGFESFAVVGHSMGARIALDLAARWPNLTTRLLLVDGSNVPEDPADAGQRLLHQLTTLERRRWAAEVVAAMMVDGLNQGQRSHLIERIVRYEDEVLLAFYQAMADWDRKHFIGSLDRISCPVKVFQATSLDENEVRRSVVCHPHSRWLDTIRRRLHSADISLVPHCGHFVMLELPGLIADWLESIAAADQSAGCEPKELNNDQRIG